MFLAMFSDGGANAGRTSYAPPPTIAFPSADLTPSAPHTAGPSPSTGATNPIAPSSAFLFHFLIILVVHPVPLFPVIVLSSPNPSLYGSFKG